MWKAHMAMSQRERFWLHLGIIVALAIVFFIVGILFLA